MPINITTTMKKTDSVNCVVYGESGVGKTVLAATAPDPIIISAEKGLLSIADKDIPVIEISSMEELGEAYQYVCSEECTQKTIILDSVSEIAEVVLADEKRLNRDGRKAYGNMNDIVMNLIRMFRDIPDKHKYFTAKQVRIEDQHTGITSYAPSLPGKTLSNNIDYFFDVVMCLRIGEDEETGTYRYLQTQPDGYYRAKDRSGKLSFAEKPDLSIIFNKIMGNASDVDQQPEEEDENG